MGKWEKKICLHMTISEFPFQTAQMEFVMKICFLAFPIESE